MYICIVAHELYESICVTRVELRCLQVLIPMIAISQRLSFHCLVGGAVAIEETALKLKRERETRISTELINSLRDYTYVIQ